MDRAGTTSGEWLHRAAAGEFDALVTVDRGFEYRHNASELPIPVVILRAVRNRVQDLEPLVPGVITVLSENLQWRIYQAPARWRLPGQVMASQFTDAETFRWALLQRQPFNSPRCLTEECDSPGLSILKTTVDKFSGHVPGHASAQYNPGLMYCNGNGVAQDTVMAHVWASIAAANGHENVATARDAIGERMSFTDVYESQGIARTCINQNFRGCGR